ncbi:ferrous iron transport protein B [Halanaerobium congolense]|jgi:ferrous iron transport protein B|uniref:Ferrous iron transport protein B n=1 Tax=Halanaerobium congolense TaxID=54121 RepID=A0A1G6JRF1_9FIRM|nr:ferrous iron transport protein B [Halanaerobium congolense]PUU93528.1 MAG: ferrous iron transport protein B [Halanaerobium sp.]PXV65158.1 ferrous iron transport protein B [Halanaerobium congolense]TDS31071.1 ferrous iron transport protein B [Halanaerobium congolense]SDC21238.1 ferrous iron transport protein B [Halanaerobium congolense]SDI30179.1 ferrous iron transport protein B [Halanaerobium congolense]
MSLNKLRGKNNEVKLALAGNPNSGKTTMFNELTGSRQHVGNWPGVTVEKKTGRASYQNYSLEVIDLPGTYSLGAYSEDEVVARDFLTTGDYDVVLNIINSANLDRNLYFTVQLLEMGVDLIAVLNMADEAEKKGIKIDKQKLGQLLGTPVVETVASKGRGIDNLFAKTVQHRDLSEAALKIDYGSEVEALISEVVSMLKKFDFTGQINQRWAAVKLIEHDPEAVKLLEREVGASKAKKIKSLIAERELKAEDDFDNIIIDRKYEFINKVIAESVQRPAEDQELENVSDKIDTIVTNKYLGIPIFMTVMWAIFKFTFTVGEPLIGYIETFFEAAGGWIGSLLLGAGASPLITSFITDGIIGGVGSVLVFIPNIFLLFLAIGVLEDSGYMSRAAYVMDKVMSKLGLHGKSFIPMIVGFGCNVPGVMATRTLDSKRDRIISILINPLMSCSARLPVYVVFAGALFSNHASTVVFSLYALGIVMAVIMAGVFNKILFKGERSHFVMELPPYRFPTLKGVFIHMWEKVGAFLKKAGTIIFSVVVLIWVLANLPLGVEYASAESLIGQFGQLIAPIFEPLGFGSWQAASSLVFGILAKEVVVGTLGVVYAAGEGGLRAALTANFSPLAAYSFLTMVLLYTPCIATLGAIKSETQSWKWPLITASYLFVLAWVVAFIVYQGGMLLGLGV